MNSSYPLEPCMVDLRQPIRRAAITASHFIDRKVPAEDRAQLVAMAEDSVVTEVALLRILESRSEGEDVLVAQALRRLAEVGGSGSLSPIEQLADSDDPVCGTAKMAHSVVASRMNLPSKYLHLPRVVHLDTLEGRISPLGAMPMVGRNEFQMEIAGEAFRFAVNVGTCAAEVQCRASKTAALLGRIYLLQTTDPPSSVYAYVLGSPPSPKVPSVFVLRHDGTIWLVGSKAKDATTLELTSVRRPGGVPTIIHVHLNQGAVSIAGFYGTRHLPRGTFARSYEETSTLTDL